MDFEESCKCGQQNCWFWGSHVNPSLWIEHKADQREPGRHGRTSRRAEEVQGKQGGRRRPGLKGTKSPQETLRT